MSAGHRQRTVVFPGFPANEEKSRPPLLRAVTRVNSRAPEGQVEFVVPPRPGFFRSP